MLMAFIQCAQRQDPLVQHEFEEIKTAIEFDHTGALYQPVP